MSSTSARRSLNLAIGAFTLAVVAAGALGGFLAVSLTGSGSASPTTVSTPSPVSIPDQDAALAEITAAAAQAYDGNATAAARLEAVRGGVGLQATLQEAFGTQGTIVTSVQAEVTHIEFYDADKAAFELSLSYDPNGEFGPIAATAVRVDGKWLVSRATFCETLRLLGATCPVDPDAGTFDEAVPSGYGAPGSESSDGHTHG